MNHAFSLEIRFETLVNTIVQVPIQSLSTSLADSFPLCLLHAHIALSSNGFSVEP